MSARVNPPRTLFVPFPLGYPLGRPHEPELQKLIIREALSLLAIRVNSPLVKNLPVQPGIPDAPQPGV